MHERRVEVVVGFADHTWRDLWISVPQNPDYVLDDDEAVEKAKDIAMKTACENDWNVSFIYAIYVEPLEEIL